SIYRWRGADVRIIRGFRRDFADALVVKLEQNYRSTANIVRAALAVIEPASSREPKKLWTSSALGSKLVVRAVVDERDEAAYTVRAIRSRLGAGVEASSIAIFYRVHAQSRVLEEAMRADNIPYQVVGGMRFFDRAEVKDIIAYLRLVDNPRSDADLLRIVNVPARGIGKRTLDVWTELAAERGTSLYDCLPQLLMADTLNNGTKKKLQAFYDLIEGFRSHAATLLPHELGRRIVDESSYRAHLVEQDNAEGDARLGNVEEFIGSIEEYEHDAEAAGETPSLLSYLERVSLVSATDAMRDVPKVSLMTVHAAKGLEFDTVILTGMEDGIFPYTRLDGGGPEDEDDERRLAYVALTRARHHLFITHSTQRSIFGQTRYLCQSPFLLDIPEECTDVQSSPGRFSSGSSRFSRSDPYAGIGQRQHDEFDQRESYHFEQDAPSDTSDASDAPPRERPSARPAPGRLTSLRAAATSTDSRVDRSAFDDLRYGAPPPAFRTGQVVEHARFGRGRVERVESGGESLAVVAKFPGFGSRKILAKFLLTTTSTA
ncbi:MAG TPA: 3'-5' exonuclease, partial [Polyangiaceae bacterium]